jgi:tetratricopeptide (TPR) repeat protein
VVLLLVAAVLLVFSWMGGWGAIRIQAAQIHSHLYGVLLIGLLGSIGGGLSASREGTLEYPSVNGDSGVINLGFLRELFFGAVGGYVLLMVTPGASEGALDLVQRYSLASAGALPQQTGQDAAGPDDKTVASGEKTATAAPGNQKNPNEKDPSVDLIELIALGVIGGYGGRWIISNSLASYVSPEQLKETETKLKEGLNSQRQRDHRALKLFDDQADLTTPAPDETALREAIMAAGATIHERIYVRARETFNLAVERAAMHRELADIKRKLGGQSGQESPSEKEHALLRPITARLRPVMRALVDLDPERRYSGSRYGLGLAYYYLGDLPAAKAMVDEAIEIAKARKRDPIVRAETIERYQKTLLDIAAAQGEQV